VECAMDHYQKESLCFEIEDHFIIQVPGTNQFIVLDQTTRELHYIDYVDKKKLDTLASIRSKLRKETVLPIIKELSDEDPESDTIEDNIEDNIEEYNVEEDNVEEDNVEYRKVCLEVQEEHEELEMKEELERVYLPEVKKVVIIDPEYQDFDTTLASN
jgi:hypothetical protein